MSSQNVKFRIVYDSGTKSFDKVMSLDTKWLVYEVKQHLLNFVGITGIEAVNLGILVSDGGDYFLSNRRKLSAYRLPELSTLLLKTKFRIISGSDAESKRLAKPRYRKKLIEYISSENLKKIGELLEKGMDPNFIYDDSGETPLTLAAAGRNVEIIEALLDADAFVEFCGHNGELALHSAVAKNNAGTLKALLESGTWPGLLNSQGVTALYTCAVYDGASCAGILIENHIPLDVTDSNGNTELHMACSYGSPMVLAILIRQGSAINARNNDGNTPLHMACLKNSESCVDVILNDSKDIDFKVVNLMGQTPYQLALFYGNNKLANKIKKCGGDVTGSISSTRRASVQVSSQTSIRKVCQSSSKGKSDAFAVFHYVANEPWELTIFPGEEVVITAKGDDQWWDVQKNSDKSRGFVPGRYLSENMTIKPPQKLSSSSLISSSSAPNRASMRGSAMKSTGSIRGLSTASPKLSTSKESGSFSASSESNSILIGMKRRKKSLKPTCELPDPELPEAYQMLGNVLDPAPEKGPFVWMAAIPPPVYTLPPIPPPPRLCVKGTGDVSEILKTIVSV